MAAKEPAVIQQLPEPPNPADRSTFNSRAYPWSEALKPWTDEVNAAGADTFYNAQLAEQSAGNAGGAVQEAKDAADRAEQHDINAFASATVAAEKEAAATASAGAAEASKTDAVTAKNAAERYAGEARQSADEAASVILGQVFDDNVESSSFGWTSSKIVSWFNGLTTAFTRTILGRSNAQQVRDDLQLTYPATAATVGSGDEIMRVGAGGWYGSGVGSETVAMKYPDVVFGNSGNTTRSEITYSAIPDNGVAGYAVTIQYGCGSLWGRLRIGTTEQNAWVQGGFIGDSSNWTAKLYHSANLLNIGTTQVTARAALGLFADASGVITDGSGVLSNDMSSFLSSMTFADMNEKLGGNNQPLPIKKHGDVATAGDQTVVCDVTESDFHIMSMATANAAGSLTISFANIPSTVGKHFTWHVRLQRGGRKPVVFTDTVVWSGNTAPTLGGNANQYDLIMFYRVDNETIRAMVIDAW